MWLWNTLPPCEPVIPSAPCKDDPKGSECCKTKTIKDSSDYCCTYDTIYANNPVCKKNYCSTCYRLSCYNQPQNYKAVCLYDNCNNTDVTVDYECTFFNASYGGTKLVDRGTFDSRYSSGCMFWECTADPWDSSVPGNVTCKFTNPTVIYKGKSYTNLPKSGCDGSTTCNFSGSMQIDCNN